MYIDDVVAFLLTEIILVEAQNRMIMINRLEKNRWILHTDHNLYEPLPRTQFFGHNQ